MNELTATDGKWLTQVAEVGDNRIYVKKIMGAHATSDNWREAEQAEKDAWDAAQKAKEVTDEDN